MKNKFFILRFVLIFVASLSVLGLIITFVRYVAEKPIAKVEIIKICLKENGLINWEPVYEFANVKILQIYNSEEFTKAATKISKDGQRANLNFSSYTKGKIQKCYAKESLRFYDGGLARWWDNFGFHWKRITGNLIVFSMIALLFVCVIIRCLKEEKNHA